MRSWKPGVSFVISPEKICARKVRYRWRILVYSAMRVSNSVRVIGFRIYAVVDLGGAEQKAPPGDMRHAGEAMLRLDVGN